MAGSVQDVAGSFYVCSVELRWLARPEPVICRDVKQRRAIGNRLRKRGAVGEIAHSNLDWETLQIAAVCAAAHQDTHLTSGVH
jgi:hypothetical protein